MMDLLALVAATFRNRSSDNSSHVDGITIMRRNNPAYATNLMLNLWKTLATNRFKNDQFLFELEA